MDEDDDDPPAFANCSTDTAALVVQPPSEPRDRLMNPWVTGFFIVGEMAGGGIVAMPRAMADSRWSGLGLILIGALSTCYTGVQLGWCWLMLRERWPALYGNEGKHCRNPYPQIALQAFQSTKLKTFVSFCIDATLFGVAVVFLLLAAENIELILKHFFSITIDRCFLVLILAAFMLLPTFLGSPKEFWPAAVCAMIMTTMAVFLIVLGASIDWKKSEPTPTAAAHDDGPVKFKQFFLAFGTIMFSYGGHSAFPTIQQDMKIQAYFNKSVMFAYILIVLLYTPVAVAGYVVYGSSVGGNIIASIQTDWIKQTVNIFITFHVLFSLLIVFNPINQEIEHAFDIPHGFTWKRAVSRTILMVCVVIVCESIPQFGLVLNLVGGSTITLLTFVFPGLFYLFLKAAKRTQPDSPDYVASIADVVSSVGKVELFINVLIIVIGLTGGLATTYAAIVDITNGDTFVTPCYLMWTK